MKLVNRSFLSVRPSQSFSKWLISVDQESSEIDFDNMEANVYLVEEDFFEVEPILKKHYKSIFINELLMACENEAIWPENRSFELFLEWFEIEVGTTVLDLEKSDLKTSKIEL